MKISYRQIWDIAKKKLKDGGVQEYELDSWYILEKVFNISKAKYYVDCDVVQEIDDNSYEKFEEMIQRRSHRIPLQYITGTQEFMGLEFYVNECVLIPRQDTEVLVETIIADIGKYNLIDDKVSKNIFNSKIDILDMCTGSGCIAISLAKLCDNTEVFGVDISKKALEVAVKNNQNLKTNVTFLESDLFDSVGLKDKKFDIIVSNPPYIRTDVIPTLMAEVKDHEPIMALDGRADGLYFYNKIIAEARNYLKLDGRLYFEIGCEQADSVSDLLIKNGYRGVEVIKDLSGLDRIVKAEIIYK